MTRRQDSPLGPCVEVDFLSLHHSSASWPLSHAAASPLLLFITFNPIPALQAAEEDCSAVMAANLAVIPGDAHDATSIFLQIATIQICCCALRIKRHQLLYGLSGNFSSTFICFFVSARSSTSRSPVWAETFTTTGTSFISCWRQQTPAMKRTEIEYTKDNVIAYGLRNSESPQVVFSAICQDTNKKLSYMDTAFPH